MQRRTQTGTGSQFVAARRRERIRCDNLTNATRVTRTDAPALLFGGENLEPVRKKEHRAEQMAISEDLGGAAALRDGLITGYRSSHLPTISATARSELDPRTHLLSPARKAYPVMVIEDVVPTKRSWICR